MLLKYSKLNLLCLVLLLYSNVHAQETSADKEREEFLKRFKASTPAPTPKIMDRAASTASNSPSNLQAQKIVLEKYWDLAKGMGEARKELWTEVNASVEKAKALKAPLYEEWEHLLYSQAFLLDFLKSSGWPATSLSIKSDEFFNASVESEKAFGMNDKNPLIMAHHAHILFLKNETARAQALLEKSKALPGDHFLTYYIMAVMLHKKQKLTEAAKAYSEALDHLGKESIDEVKKEMIKARYAQLKAVWDNDHDAENYHKQNIAENPDQILPLYQYAKFLSEKNRHGEAKGYLKEAKKMLKPDNPFNQMVDSLSAKVEEKVK